MTKWILPLCAIALSTAVIAPAQADVRVGTLRCDVSPGISYLIGSQKALNCAFYSANGYRERYVGDLTRLGIDIGYTTGGALAWWVYAPSRPGPGALAGGYVGASAEATVAAGVSANALVGGLDNSITLQPFSVGAQGGLDAALTASGMRLDWVQAERRKRARKHR
jgi:uncharacterized protein DUF992